ncbi:MAG: sensor histidine kinase [bacterium]|nr:sensor histidine kinase [bacterium]
MFQDRDCQVLRGREEERRRLARDLHDGLLQALVNLSLAVDRCERRWREDPRSAGEELVAVREAIATAVEEGRGLLAELRPVLPGEVGLPEAMRRYGEGFGDRSGIKARFSVSGPVRPLSPLEELAVFRVFQEALSNVAKHAGARSVEVSLAYRAQQVSLRVRDDGRGLTCRLATEELLEAKKYGVLGMRERAAALGGELTVQARTGGGTQVELVLPGNRIRV